ncbi:hypothetical protein BT96DRAFT_1008118 [Gymnopus androsaceus JB14]|uniref:Uncharacterized protein n=1 Tax=Gymnopus androsaceus JB14 TaxID=1447944 RepID=A0A6A4GFZ2_9AGAR|nr:hypothetical protein BT96DRAFT_1008118 [Gymnopus androsaceus JB14]
MILQEKVCVGRDPNDTALGVLLVLSSTVKKVAKYLNAVTKGVPTTILIDHSIALLLTKKICYIACINRIYCNPPLALTDCDCIAADRAVKYSLCSKRAGITISLESSPTSTPFPKQPPVQSTSSRKKSTSLDLTKKEHEKVVPLLVKFSESVWETESLTELHQFRPRESYFLLGMQNCILSNFLHISSLEMLQTLLKRYHWAFWDTQGQHLCDLILSQAIVIRESRRRQQLLQKRRREAKESEADEYSEDSISESELLPLPKRVALQPSSRPNTLTPQLNPRPKPRPRAKAKPLEAMWDVLDSYSAQCPNL